MVLNSQTSITEHEALKSSVYSGSEESENIFTWVYPTQLSLINGIYAQTIPLSHLLKREIEADIESELARMAVDPDIQREIGLINVEFAETEWDGLDDNS